ncbi:hypothetical protein [Streptosporangium sp. KLBMP 9127]|nr:hypothetical protein [Streptosporangium sp. KLBMP 9127]
MPRLIDADALATAIEHLTQLRDLLTERGLHARLLTDSRRLPCLQVVHLVAATALTEHILAAPKEGTWRFWWSWGEQIGCVSDITTTADRIQHVLAPTASTAATTTEASPS